MKLKNIIQWNVKTLSNEIDIFKGMYYNINKELILCLNINQD